MEFRENAALTDESYASIQPEDPWSSTLAFKNQRWTSGLDQLCNNNQQQRLEKRERRFMVFKRRRKRAAASGGGEVVPVFLAAGSGANSLTVTLGNIHCIQRLTFPLVPPMLLVFCSRVTGSANGPSSPAGTESP